MRHVLLAIVGIAISGPAQAEQALSHSSFSQAVASYAGAAEPGEWTSEARDYANTRYSPLDQINAGNVRAI